MSNPLQYKISSWYQLPQCKSNLSTNYYLTVTDILEDRLTGTRISICDKKYGSLFTILISASGSGIHEANSVITDSNILKELSRYGFDIEYSPAKHLPSDLLKYLITLKDLKFDKLRLLAVKPLNKDEYDIKVIAFMSAECPMLLNNMYKCDESAIRSLTYEGHAINLSGVKATNKYDWTWLDGWIANISDVLDENLN